VFPITWARAQEALTQEIPPILGRLDMYHLPYYAGIYHQRHIPIHFCAAGGL